LDHKGRKRYRRQDEVDRMKKERALLKIFTLSHPLLETEWLSLLGDKYSGALEFDFIIVDDVNEAQVVVWDGIITPKNTFYIKPLLEKIKTSKILLLQGEMRSLFTGHPFVKMVNLENMKYVELPGLSVLPEELLGALEQCYQKLQPNV
jgi:Ni,Fe-hydrogenase III small subunit